MAYNKIWHGLWRDTTHSAKIGADYFINSKNTIGFSANGRVSNHNGGGESETFISKNSGPPPTRYYFLPKPPIRRKTKT